MNKDWLLALAAVLGLAHGMTAPSATPPISAADLRALRTRRDSFLKIDWGKPGFCTEFATDYDPTAGRCASGGRPYKRKIISREEERP